MKITLNNEFSSFFKSIHLRGIIGQAVIDFQSDGTARCQAVDLTNTVLVDSKIENIRIEEDYRLGVGNLATICKYVEGANDVSVEIENKWVVLRKKGKGTIKFLEVEPSLVSTLPEETVDCDQLITESSVVVPLSKDMADNFIEHFSLVGGPSLVVTSDKKRVFISSNENSNEQYKVPFGKAISDETVRIEVYSDFFVAILREIDFSKTPIDMIINNDLPLLIQQTNTTWAVTPIME